MLAECYLQGYGVVPNYAKVVEYDEKSGNNVELYNLGIMLNGGDDKAGRYNQPIKKDSKLAFQAFEKAANIIQKNANNNHFNHFVTAEVYYALGWCYYNGNGVQKNNVKAKEWLQKAAPWSSEGGILAQDLLRKIR
jgi:TPR repeat protein